MTDRPAQTSGLDISPVEDGYVVYDASTDLVHYLNPTAAVTLELCDGQRTAEEITSFMTSMFTAPGQDVHAAVLGCIDQLRGLGLLTCPAEEAAPGPVTGQPEQEPVKAG
jgi:hypothetical protein